jgi:hypothetical protein
MPAALDVNWGAVKLAFARGATQRELAEAFDIDYSTLANRCARESWMDLRKPKDSGESLVRASESIWQKRAEEAREDWNVITGKVRKHLKDAPPDAIVAKADKLKAINDIERKNLGLDKDQSNSYMQVGIQLIGTNDAPIEAELTDFSSESV